MTHIYMTNWLKHVSSSQQSDYTRCSLQILQRRGPQQFIAHDFIIKAFSSLRNLKWMSVGRMRPLDAGRFVSLAATFQHRGEELGERLSPWAIKMNSCASDKWQYLSIQCLLALQVNESLSEEMPHSIMHASFKRALPFWYRLPTQQRRLEQGGAS